VPVDVLGWGRDLVVGRAIGQGAEGAVYEARYMDAPVAVKQGASTSEIELHLAAGAHDNLVGLRGLVQKEDDGAWCLVLELCSRGTLDSLLHSPSSPLSRAPSPAPFAAASDSTSGAGAGTQQQPQVQAQVQAQPQAQSQQPQQPQQPQQQLTRPDLPKLLPLLRGIVRGVLHLHTRTPPILHRDIKPSNVLIGHGMQVCPLRAALTASSRGFQCSRVELPAECAC
jgi:serine/threonine protein kinase